MPANPLAPVHAQLGAFLVERAGTPIPSRFGDPVAEHEAVRRAAGVFDLNSAGKTWVTGGERARFLHGLLSADVLALRPGEGAYSLLLTRDGRIASDLRVAVLEGRTLLLTPSISRGKVHRTLERHVVATDAKLEDATETWALLAVQGPASRGVVGSALGAAVPEIPPRGVAEVATAAHGSVVLVRSPRTGEDGLDVLVRAGAAPAVFRALVEAARAAGGLPCGLEAYEALRVEAGRPSYGVEIDETTLPSEIAALAHGISGGKGCFLGRQALEAPSPADARTRRLVGVAFGGRYPPVRGDRLHAGGAAVGRVTTACWSPGLGHAIALALVDAAVAAPGTAVQTQDGEPGTVAALPFVPAKLA